MPLAKQAYLELDNPNPTAVDISGWKLTGAATLTFRPGGRPPRSALNTSVCTMGTCPLIPFCGLLAGTVIPPQGSIFVSPNVVAFRGRTTSPMAGQGRFVQVFLHHANTATTVPLLQTLF